MCVCVRDACRLGREVVGCVCDGVAATVARQEVEWRSHVWSSARMTGGVSAAVNA